MDGIAGILNVRHFRSNFHPPYHEDLRAPATGYQVMEYLRGKECVGLILVRYPHPAQSETGGITVYVMVVSLCVDLPSN